MTELVVVAAPAKLTLSLRITGVRADGYHLIDAEMVALDLVDRLTIDPSGSGVRVEGAGFAVDGDTLVEGAMALCGVTAHVRVAKAIPAGAGLGGGSSDAAAFLRWAGYDDLVGAARLGADVPFCLVGGRARVRGIGELVEPLPHEDRVLTLYTPEFGCSTPEVYARWDELGGPTGEGGNDLEPAALAVEPRLAAARDHLGDCTGATPRLAGSGSTWFVEGAHRGPGLRVVRTVAAPAR